MGSSREQAALLLVLLPLLAGYTHGQSTVLSSPLPETFSPSQPTDTSPQNEDGTTRLQASTEFYSSAAPAGSGTQSGTQAVMTYSQPGGVTTDNDSVSSGATTAILSATTEAGSTVERTGTATVQQVVANDTTTAPVTDGQSSVTSITSVGTHTTQAMATTEEVLGTGFEDLVPSTDQQPDSPSSTKLPETTTPRLVPAMVNTTMASTAVPGNATENATALAFVPRLAGTTSRPVVSTRVSTEEPVVSTTVRVTTVSMPRTTTEDLSRAVPAVPSQTTTVLMTTTTRQTTTPLPSTTTTTEAVSTSTLIPTTTVSTPGVVKGTTSPPKLIPSKNPADLTSGESDNIVTVFFNGTRSKLTRNVWIREHDEMFREELSDIINEDSNDQLDVQPADVIYVEPTPRLRREELLEISIFVYNRTKTDNRVEKRDADQPTVSKDVLEAALNKMKDMYEEEDREIKIVEVSPGLTAPRPALPTRQTSIFGEYFSLFIALIVIACVCVVIILLGVLYLCVRKKKGKLRDHEKVIADDGLRLDSYQALDNPGATFTDDEMPEPNGKPKAEEAWTVKPSAPPPPNGRIAENTEEEDTHL